VPATDAPVISESPAAVQTNCLSPADYSDADGEYPPYVHFALDAFGGARRNVDGWLARCPVHGVDRHPSLRLTVGDGGRILVRCRVGCETAAPRRYLDAGRSLAAKQPA
jgi:hypothetical protein